jgi:hypothetical protein
MATQNTQTFMSVRQGKGCCNAQLFWQQEIDESLLLKRLYTKGGQWKCCFFLGILCVGLGAILLAEAGKVQEVVIPYGINDKSIDVTIDEDMKGEVFFYYGLDNFYGNYRNYVENRENILVGSSLMRYRCKGEGAPAHTLNDAQMVRNMESNPEKFADLAKHLTPDVMNPGAENGQTLYPCGLVAFSMFLDEYSLYKIEGSGSDMKVSNVTLNFQDLAWSSDVAHFDDVIVEENGEWKVRDKYKEVSFKSWIRNDLLKERFAVWYRTSASTKVKHLWARIPEGLPKGTYKLNFDVNGPIWDDWLVKKSVILSTVSSTGGKGNGFIALSCIIWGVLLLLCGLIWLAAPKPVRKVVEGEEGDASDPNWASPR